MTAWCFHRDDLDKALERYLERLQYHAYKSDAEVAQLRDGITGFLESAEMNKSRFEERKHAHSAAE